MSHEAEELHLRFRLPGFHLNEKVMTISAKNHPNNLADQVLDTFLDTILGTFFVPNIGPKVLPKHSSKVCAVKNQKKFVSKIVSKIVPKIFWTRRWKGLMLYFIVKCVPYPYKHFVIQ